MNDPLGSPPRSHGARRFGTGMLLVTLAAGLAVGVAGTLLAQRGGAAHGPATAAPKPRYVCPMHPTVVSDHPGNCPICGMKLVPAPSQGPAALPSSRPGGERKIAFYRSPMDPKQTSPVPRKDEMGMDYVPVYEDEVSGHGAPQVKGLATVDIDPQRQQLIGLHTAPVTEGPVGGSWRTVGRVAVAEPRVHHVNVKVAGFVERIHVDYVGQLVKKGDPLFSLYSPDLLSAQQEYLLALRTQKALRAGTAMSKAGDDLVASARERLRLWDIPEPEIARLVRTGEPRKTLTLYAPVTGVVTKKDVVQGHRLQEGDMPYEITDLQEVWVLADAYESDLPHVKLGMPATLHLEAFPNRVFRGKVVFVDPILDPKTRTAKVRLSFPNTAGELRPEMFGEVTLHAPARQGLRVPADAVIDSGTAKIVFVALGAGKFQPREVKLGAPGGDLDEVVSGLQAGEQVVTRANFLIDSESRLRASLEAMGGK